MRTNISKQYPIVKALVNTSINFEGQHDDCLSTNSGGFGT